MIPGQVSKLTESAIVAATTIAPLTDLLLVSGTTNIATITPPPHLGGVSSGVIFIVPTAAAGFSLLTTGNIAGAASISCTANRVVVLTYSAAQSKWYANVGG